MRRLTGGTLGRLVRAGAVSPYHDYAALHTALLEFDRYLSPGDVRVALDLGSRDALIALGLARYYRHAHVYAFECNPAAISLCRKNLRDFGGRPGRLNVRLVEQAVSDVTGSITFYPINTVKTVTSLADGNIGASSLFQAREDYPHETYVQDQITVSGTRLDDWAQEAGLIRLDVLWIDLQGAELRALQGLGALLQTVKVMYCEVSYRPLYEGAPLYPHVEAFLQQQGFTAMGAFNTSEWSGDVVFVRNDLLARTCR